MKLSPKRILSIIAISILLASLTILAVYLKNVADYKKAVKDISFGKIEISNVPDGVYLGECDVNFIYAKVKVTVQSGRITDIDLLEHKNERGKSAEIIIEKIIENQIINVDAISGATNSSVVIEKAVANALADSESEKSE